MFIDLGLNQEHFFFIFPFKLKSEVFAGAIEQEKGPPAGSPFLAIFRSVTRQPSRTQP